ANTHSDSLPIIDRGSIRARRRNGCRAIKVAVDGTEFGGVHLAENPVAQADRFVGLDSQGAGAVDTGRIHLVALQDGEERTAIAPPRLVAIGKGYVGCNLEGAPVQLQMYAVDERVPFIGKDGRELVGTRIDGHTQVIRARDCGADFRHEWPDTRLAALVKVLI